jgi:hypothetical protein
MKNIAMEILPAVKKLLLLLFYLHLVGCSGCKDSLQPDINQLSPITQDGANTFGAIVNGKVWVILTHQVKAASTSKHLIFCQSSIP